MKDLHQATRDLAGRPLTLETGQLAFQANAAVKARYGDTVVLATATSVAPQEEVDFFPLRVDFEEKLYAGGIIKNSRFVKREGRASDDAIISGRVIDRGIRPLFPKDLQNEVQVVVTVLSVDGQNDPSLLGALAASTALSISDIPWNGPLATVRVGLINDQLTLNPTREQMEASRLDLVLSFTREKVVMIEAEANEVPEAQVTEALKFGWQEGQALIGFIESFAQKIGRAKYDYEKKVLDEALLADVRSLAALALEDLLKGNPEKAEFERGYQAIAESLYQGLEGKYTKSKMLMALDGLQREKIRGMILNEGKRMDRRALDELRPLSAEVGLLPRTHGSALFTRGLTQALTITTLGSASLEQLIERPEGEETKRYIHHYSAAPFSTGEVGSIRGPGRREIGHGALAEKALEPVIPSKEEFPYTIRIVSEILSQNGSSSMASVCGSTLSLMDAGVPIRTPVAGVSMGLVTAGDHYVLLTDIAGVEDFNGDMDFKSAGTRSGVTALQLDVKIPGVNLDVLSESLSRALVARLKILDLIESTIPRYRSDLSKYAPRIISLKIDPRKIGEVVGSGGKNIRSIMEATSTAIDIEDDGTVYVSAAESGSAEKARSIIESLVKEAKVGELYEGRVSRILDFGAFVEILPGKEGLIHISELAPFRVGRVTDVVRIGDRVKVKVIGIDDQGRVNLSRKAVLREETTTRPHG